MKNISVKTNGNKLTITIDLSKSFGESKSGKTEIVATTGGNVIVDVDTQTKMGINVYKPISKD